MKPFKFLTAVVALLNVTGALSASVIYDLDFETQTGVADNYNPNYDQADPSAISTLSYTAGAGLDGSRAAQVDFDTTSDPFSVSYFTNIENSSVAAPTSSDISNYVLSFDIQIVGFDADDSQVYTQYSLQLNDVEYQGILNSSANYQSVTANLGDLTELSGGTFDLGDFSTGIRRFKISFNGLNDKFDLDADNSYFIDNIQLHAVPEPSSLILLSAGVLSVFLIRRRRQTSVSPK